MASALNGSHHLHEHDMIERNHHQRKLDLTLDQLVLNMQADRTKSRDSQLYAFQAAVSVLELARANPDDDLSVVRRAHARLASLCQPRRRSKRVSCPRHAHL